MSYEIEHGKTVIRLHPSLGNNPDYFAMHKLASNNVSPRDFSYNYVGFGWEYNIVGAACRLAADAESGVIKPYNNDVQAEAYIQQWRRALKKAVDFEAFMKKHYGLYLELAVRKENIPKIDKLKEWEVEKAKPIMDKWEKEDYPFFDHELVLIKREVKDEQDIRDFVSLRGILKDAGLIYWVKIE